MSTLPRFTASTISEIMSSDPVMGLLKGKQAPKTTATATKAAASRVKATLTVTEIHDGSALTNRTPLKDAATPSKCVAASAENAANATSNGSIPATSTTCSTKAPVAPVGANQPKTGINLAKKAASNPSSLPTKPATKRAKRGHTFKSRRGPSFKGAEALEASNTGVSLEFSTTCYYVQLGESGQPFFIHEAALSRSRKLFDEVEKAKGKLCKTQQQIIQLLPHDAGAFSQMVNFLYSGQFKPLECNKGPKMIGHRMKELQEAMSLAKYYDVPGLQKDIMRVVSKDRLVHRVNAATFFDWAEDMWNEEMDKRNGSFAMYFRRFAPDILQKASEQDLKGMKFTNQGGDYLKELFIALHKAMSIGRRPAIKLESDTVKTQRFSQGPVSPDADIFRG